MVNRATPPMEESWLSRWAWLLLIFWIGGILTIGGYTACYQWLASRIRQEKYHDLAGIAAIKTRQIERYLHQRQMEVTILTQSPFVLEVFESPTGAGRTTDRDLTFLMELEGYSRIELLTLDGQVQYSKTGSSHLGREWISVLIQQALDVPIAFVSDLHGDSPSTIHIDVVSAVRDEQGRPLGILLVSVLASDELYPLLETWPTPSPSAETLLVRRDGDEVLFLNDLRNRPGTALKHRYPLSRSDLPANQAVLGKTGLFYGKDYRSVPVLADLRPISDTRWFLVTKIDEKELLADLIPFARLVAVLIVLSLAGLLLAGAYLHKRREMIQKQAVETKLRASEEKYRTIIESSPAGMLFGRIDSQSQFVLVDANPAAQKMFQRTMESISGQFIDQILPGISQSRLPEVWQRMIDGQCQAETLEISLTVAERPGWFFVTVFRASPGTAVLIFIDITDRRQAEAQQQTLTQELEQANRELKQFASIISHDLRSPLVNLQGFSSELNRSLEPILRATQKGWETLDEAQRQEVLRVCQADIPEALGFIQTSVSHMDSYISALLKLTRMGHLAISLQPIDMNQLLDQTLQAYSHQIKERHIRIAVQSLPRLVADPMLMKQILANLLDNAIKYLPPDRPGQIEVCGWQTAQETFVCIGDNGRGIANDDMDKVFAPFRRAGRRDVPGEGMGLAYVQAMIRRHGGRILCASQIDVGSQFTFAVPHPSLSGA